MTRVPDLARRARREVGLACRAIQSRAAGSPAARSGAGAAACAASGAARSSAGSATRAAARAASCAAARAAAPSPAAATSRVGCRRRQCEAEDNKSAHEGGRKSAFLVATDSIKRVHCGGPSLSRRRAGKTRWRTNYSGREDRPTRIRV